MDQPDRDWQTWVRRLAAGDSAVVAEFWAGYGPRLQAVAARYMTTRLLRREGPEDVVQSACLSFFRRVGGGQFDLSERENLWRLLCALTVSKVLQKRRYHRRLKRSVGRERDLSPAEDAEGLDLGPADTMPDPAEQAEMAEHIERLLAALDDEERRVVELKLEDCTNHEVGQRLGCSERTVRRIVARVQHRWQRMLDESP